MKGQEHTLRQELTVDGKRVRVHRQGRWGWSWYAYNADNELENRWRIVTSLVDLTLGDYLDRAIWLAIQLEIKS